MTNFDAPYNREDFLGFLANSFLPSDFEARIQDTSYTPGETTKITKITKITKLGNCAESLKKIAVYEVIHTSQNDARVTLSREIFSFMKRNSAQYALVAFVPEDNPDVYRLSFIKMSPKDNNGKLEFERFNPKRYSFLLGVGQHTRTPEKYLIKGGKVKSLEDLSDRFSIEVLTKDFYKELFSWYQWMLSAEAGVAFPDNGNAAEHVIRLITRLMFVWFLKQKHLVPDEIFDAEKLKSILKNFDATDQNQDSYYRAILQNLFFATLNNKIEERKFAVDGSFYENKEQYGVKTLYRYADGFAISENDVVALFAKVPFLNGGLFECLDKETPDSKDKIMYVDGFSRNPQKRAHIPNALFFYAERGLLSILKRYNFTIEENSPDDVEVALDPELLGKVFENLLGAYNPETKETARKQSGSFYTPREIVNYMVKTSLDEYEKAGGDLDKVKILDPACGSGAFPMGILNEIVERKKQQNPNFNLYETKLNIIENSIYGVDIQPIAIQISKLRFFISLIVEQTANDNPNENYGILPLPNLEVKFVAANTLIALDEGKKNQLDLRDNTLQEMKNKLWEIRNHKNLRASSWQEKVRLRKEDKKLCEEIEQYLIDNTAKPNEKLIADNRAKIEKLRNEMSELKEEWVDDRETSLFGDETQQNLLQKDLNEPKRNKLAEQIKRLEAEIAKEDKKGQLTGMEVEIKKMTSWNPYDQNTASPFFDAEWMFGLKDGFDIVIGNPPYVDSEHMLLSDLKNRELYTTIYKSTIGNWDLFVPFVEKGIDISKSLGIISFIIPNKIISQDYAKGIREIISNNQLLEIRDYSRQNVFPVADVYPVTILLKKNNIEYDVKMSTMLNIIQVEKTNSVSNKIMNKYQWDIFFCNPELFAILVKITNCCAVFKNYVSFSSPCTVDEAYKIKEFLHDSSTIVDSKKFINSGTIDKYLSKWGVKNTTYIKGEYLYPIVANSLLSNMSEKRYLQSALQKIIVANMTTGLEAFFDINGEYLAGKSTVMGIGEYTNLLFLTALLNSKLISVWYKFVYNSTKMKGGALSVTADRLNDIPIPDISKEQQQPIIALVDQILSSKKENPLSNTMALEQEIDRLVYGLYGLTEEEIRIIEKQQKLKGEIV